MDLLKISRRNMAKQKDRTECPVSRQQFLKAAKPLTLSIDGRSVVASVKGFSIGSFGWFGNEKVSLQIDGVFCKAQANVNLIVVGSEEAN
jgi:hypothetical protein